MMTIPDPLEQIIRTALIEAKIDFEHPGPSDLDFYLPLFDLHIEVTAFHTPRKIEQLSRAQNVILLQGRAAVEFFTLQLKRKDT